MRYKPFINIKDQLKQFVAEGCKDSQIKRKEKNDQIK